MDYQVRMDRFVVVTKTGQGEWQEPSRVGRLNVKLDMIIVRFRGNCQARSAGCGRRERLPGRRSLRARKPGQSLVLAPALTDQVLALSHAILKFRELRDDHHVGKDGLQGPT